MGLDSTFGVIRSLSREDCLQFLEMALAEPYDEIQGPAFTLLADPQGINRPDLIVRSFPTLVPAMRKRIEERKWHFINVAKDQIRGNPEKIRRAAYEMLAAFGEVDVAHLLAMAVNDASTAIRENAANAVEKLALRYHYHLLNWRSQGDEKSRIYVEENRALMTQALEVLLRTYQIHRKVVFIDIAIELGGPAYRLITDIVLSHGESPAYKGFIHCMGQAHSEAAMEMLFKLYFEREGNLHQAALDVMKTRMDAGFPVAIASWLGKLPPERFLQLSTRTREVLWWAAVEQNPDLEPIPASKLLEFLSKSFLEPKSRDAMVAALFRSRYGEVRSRVLLTLRELRSPLTLEFARKALEDPADEVKLTGGKLISELRPSDRARLLAPLVASGCDELRRIAVKEIANVSFDRYLRSFDRLDERTRELAARALAKIDLSMMDRLTEEINSLEPKRRLKALKIVNYVDAEEDLRPMLLELLNDPDTHVRAAVVKIVELSGNVEGMKLLISALSDPDRRVRANAVEAFEEIGDERFASLLLPFVKDPDNRVRANAAKALWTLGHKEVREVLEGMLEEPDENSRLSAAWALGELRYDGAAEVLSARQDRETSEKVKAKIFESLARIRSFREEPKGES